MEIALATDHAGFELKETIKGFLTEKGIAVKDFGAAEYDAVDDYPDFITPVAEYISKNKDTKGIIFGGSGQGEAMAANRVQGVRAAVYYDGPIEIVKLSRQHNDANVLSLGARFISPEKAKEIISIWLQIEFEGGRHQRRIDKLG